MTLRDLAALVKQMRDAQRGYFRDRSPQRLNHAKELERRVDAELERILTEEKRLF